MFAVYCCLYLIISNYMIRYQLLAILKYHYSVFLAMTTNINKSQELDENGVEMMFMKLTNEKEVMIKEPPTGSGGIQGEGYKIDQRNDGVRYNFKGDFAPALDFGGYFKPKGVGNMDDEVSFKFFGGTHDKDNPEFSRCYDIGIHFNESTVRLRTEHEHNEGGGGPYVQVEEHKPWFYL